LLAALGAPPNLPQTLDLLARDMASIRENTRRMADQGEAQGDVPQEAEQIVIALDSAQKPNNWYATSDQLRIVAIDFWADTNGKWYLQLENDRYAFRTNANNKTRVIDPPGRFVLARGLRIGFTLDGQAPYVSGEAVWSAIMYALPGTAQGRQS
jgi:hypothetical protein